MSEQWLRQELQRLKNELETDPWDVVDSLTGFDEDADWLINSYNSNAGGDARWMLAQFFAQKWGREYIEEAQYRLGHDDPSMEIQSEALKFTNQHPFISIYEVIEEYNKIADEHDYKYRPMF